MQQYRGSGDHRGLGRGMGQAFRDTIARILGELKVADKLTPANLERLRAMEERVGLAYPHLIEEIAGIAEGAERDYQEVLAYNLLTSVSWACTNVAFTGGPEGAVIGKTNDIGENRAYYHVPVDLTFPSGMRLLSFTWPGTVWCNAGLNRYGIAQAGASVGTETVNGRGLESNLLQRVILEHSTDLGEAVDIAMSYPAKNHAANITLSDGESLVVVEKGVGEAAVRFPRDGAIFATNHWVSPRMSQVCRTASPEFEANTRGRWANLERLTTEATGCNTAERMMAILRNHADPGAICQHGPFMHSSVAYVLVPSPRRAYFAFGRPCEAEFVRFGL